MKWCMLMLLRNAGGRTRHGFRNATRAVRLPIDGALQPIVALDVAPGAVGAALAAYGSRGRACAGSVVVKGRARASGAPAPGRRPRRAPDSTRRRAPFVPEFRDPFRSLLGVLDRTPQ